MIIIYSIIVYKLFKYNAKTRMSLLWRSLTTLYPKSQLLFRPAIFGLNSQTASFWQPHIQCLPNNN